MPLPDGGRRLFFLASCLSNQCDLLGKLYAVYRGKGNAGDYGLLLSAMVVQKSEDVIRPDGGSKIAKGMAVLRGVAVWGIDLHLVRLARVLHHCRESLARR